MVPLLREGLIEQVSEATSGLQVESTVSAPTPDSQSYENPSTKPKQIYARGTVPYNGIKYCSLHEATCSALLQKAMPDFVAIDGETVQVPIGAGRSVDFRVRGVFLEYHEPRPFLSSRKLGEYRNWQEYFCFVRALEREGSTKKRISIMNEQKKILMQRYWLRRRAALDENPETRSADLIVAYDFDSIYDRVILRFSPNTAPAREEARILYDDLKSFIIRDAKLPFSPREINRDKFKLNWAARLRTANNKRQW